jgi:hypothetical protein
VRLVGVRAPLTLTARAEAGAPANLSIEQTPPEGRAGRPLGSGITAVVTDVYGNPVPDAGVSFATRGGTVSPARAVSDARGRVQVKWTLGPKDGEQVLTGSVRGTDVKSALAVLAAAAPAAPAPAARPAAKASDKQSARTNARASVKTAPASAPKTTLKATSKSTPKATSKSTPKPKSAPKPAAKAGTKTGAGSRARGGRGA